MVYIAALFFFTLLGTAYVKGYDMVKARQPEYLPHYYLIMATIRVVLVLTMTGTYIWLANDKTSTVRFAGIVMLMYAAMMVIALRLRH